MNTMTIPKELRAISKRNHRAAVKRFNLAKGWVLHHKDTHLIETDVNRYIEWRDEDLIPLSKSEHSRLHAYLLHQEGRANLNGLMGSSIDKKWFTNGIDNIFAYECPENYWEGKVQINKNKSTKYIELSGRAVQCIETGEIFPSAKSAASKFSSAKAGNANILMAIKNNGTAYGYHWKRYD